MTLMISGGGGGGGGGATALGGLTDVTLGVLANGQILQYNSGSGQWENTALTGQLTYQGAFDANAGTPALTNALQGDFYVVSVAGTQFGRDWAIGDHLLINEDMGGSITNSKIDKIDNTDQVTSVNGQTGAVTGLLEAGNNLSDLTNVPNARSNLSLGAAATANDTDGVPEGAANLYFTDARADARIAAADMTDLNDVSYTAGPAIDNYVLTYDNATNSWGAEPAGAAPVDSVNGATGVVVLDSDDIAEGAANLYFTDARSDARADARIAAADLTDLNDVSYTAGPAIDNYVLTFDNATSSWGAEAAASAPVDSVNGATGVVVLDSDDIAEGAANLYFTDARADARIAAADLTDLNDVSYTAGPGIDNYVLTYDNATSSWGAEPAAGGGGSRPGVYTQSASFTIGDGTGTDPGAVTAAELERVYLINNAGSAVTVTLPAIGGNVGAGLKFNIKMLGSANVTIGRNGANIEGAAADQTLTVQYSSYTLCCAGASGWYII